MSPRDTSMAPEVCVAQAVQLATVSGYCYVNDNDIANVHDQNEEAHRMTFSTKKALTMIIVMTMSVMFIMVITLSMVILVIVLPRNAYGFIVYNLGRS